MDPTGTNDPLTENEVPSSDELAQKLFQNLNDIHLAKKLGKQISKLFMREIGEYCQRSQFELIGNPNEGKPKDKNDHFSVFDLYNYGYYLTDTPGGRGILQAELTKAFSDGISGNILGLDENLSTILSNFDDSNLGSYLDLAILAGASAAFSYYVSQHGDISFEVPSGVIPEISIGGLNIGFNNININTSDQDSTYLSTSAAYHSSVGNGSFNLSLSGTFNPLSSSLVAGFGANANYSSGNIDLQAGFSVDNQNNYGTGEGDMRGDKAFKYNFRRDS